MGSIFVLIFPWKYSSTYWLLRTIKILDSHCGIRTSVPSIHMIVFIFASVSLSCQFADALPKAVLKLSDDPNLHYMISNSPTPCQQCWIRFNKLDHWLLCLCFVEQHFTRVLLVPYGKMWQNGRCCRQVASPEWVGI